MGKIKITQRKIIPVITILLVLSGAGFLLGKYLKNFSKTYDFECPVKVEERIVRGGSLEGLIEDGQTVKILFGYYSCHKIKKGDVVAYNFSGDKVPIIKIVKAIPGDKFQLKQSSNGWNILINNEILKNSQSQPYILNEKGYKILSLYENDYKGVIPENAYLILGNLASGSLDSSHFGLVDKSDILGKVEAIR